MKEIDFLPSGMSRPGRRLRWRIGTLAAGAVLILVVSGLHAMRPIQITSAQTGKFTPATHESNSGNYSEMPPGIQGTPSPDQRVERMPINTVLDEIHAAESQSVIVENLDIRSGSTSFKVHLNQNHATKSAKPAIPSLLPSENGQPLSAELVGIAATDMDIGILSDRLNKCPFVSNVRITDARNILFNNRKMREFKILFAIQNRTGPRSIGDAP